MAQGNDTRPIGFDKDLAKTLCELEVPNNVKLSPNGDRVIYGAAAIPLKGKHYMSALWIASTSEAGSARQLTSGKFLDSSPAWHPDGQHVAFLSDRWKGEGGISRIWMMRLYGGDAYPLSPAESEQSVTTFSFSPDGETVAYLSRDEKTKEDKERDEKGGDNVNVWGERWPFSRLRLLDVKTKLVRTLVEGNRHVTDFAWSHDGKSLLFQSTETTDVQSSFIGGTTVSAVGVESGDIRDLCIVRTAITDMAWGANGKVYLVLADFETSLASCDVVFSIDTTEARPQLVKAACGDKDSAGRLRSAAGKVLVQRYIRESTAITELDGDDVFTTDFTIRSWDVVVDKGTNDPIFAAVMSDINRPNEVFVIKHGRIHHQLSEHGRVLQHRQFGSFTVLTCPSTDGEVELDGLYLTPKVATTSDGTPDKPLPTVVLIHGGPTDHDTNSFNAFGYQWTPYLLSRGYGVLLPQYRGSTGRGEAFACYSKDGMGGYAYDDVIAITDNAVKKGFADSKRLLVGGWSGGGLLSFLSAVRNGLHGFGWRFNAAVPGAGICDVQTICLTSDLGTTVLTELSGAPGPWLSDKTDTKSRDSSAIWEFANAIRESQGRKEPVIPPVLILHGENDSRCPVSQARAFHHALSTSGLPCELVTYPGQGHNPMRFAHWMDMLERLERWCDKYIGYQ